MTSSQTSRIQRLAGVLWLLFAAYLLYATVVPFDLVFSKAAIAHKIDAIEWVPFVDKEEGGLAPRPDLLANTVLFVPFGFLGFWARRQIGRGALSAGLRVVGLGLALSLSIEILQLLTRTRYTATTDLIVNTVGAVLGVALGVLSIPPVERVARSPRLLHMAQSHAAFAALAAGVTVGVRTWQPFQFSLDASVLLPKLRAFAADPWSVPSALSHEPLDFLVFALFSLAVGALLREQGVRLAGGRALLACATVAIVLEPTRFAVHDQSPAAAALAAKLMGCAVGAVATVVIRRRQHVPLRLGLMFAATAAVVACAALVPYQPAATLHPFGWVPFLPYYDQATVDAVADLLDTVLQFLPLGFVVGLLVPGQRWVQAGCVAMVALLATALEVAQRALPGRTPDVTDVLVAVAGVLLGLAIATRGAARFRAFVSDEPRPGRVA